MKYIWEEHDVVSGRTIECCNQKSLIATKHALNEEEADYLIISLETGLVTDEYKGFHDMLGALNRLGCKPYPVDHVEKTY